MNEPIGQAARLTVTIFLNTCDDEIRMLPGFRSVTDSQFAWEGEMLSPEWSVAPTRKAPKQYKPLDRMQTKSGG